MFEPKAQPTINLDTLKNTLTSQEFELVEGIISSQGKNKGRLRASKPKVKRDDTIFVEIDGQQVKASKSGVTAYVWRMVAFEASAIPQHHCMPVTADWDLNIPHHTIRRAAAVYLDTVADAVLDTVPVNNRYGLLSWGRALGRL